MGEKAQRVNPERTQIITKPGPVISTSTELLLPKPSSLSNTEGKRDSESRDARGKSSTQRGALQGCIVRDPYLYLKAECSWHSTSYLLIHLPITQVGNLAMAFSSAAMLLSLSCKDHFPSLLVLAHQSTSSVFSNANVHPLPSLLSCSKQDNLLPATHLKHSLSPACSLSQQRYAPLHAALQSLEDPFETPAKISH